ncbi:hypothetical protein BC831DRAFT_456151 [Entophlyctis helioformis]|nr:hypothetical protein BC831DRAFT_456151 [Entophlyctis helioformis]
MDGGPSERTPLLGLTEEGFPDDPPPYYTEEDVINDELPSYQQLVDQARSSLLDDDDWSERCGSIMLSCLFFTLIVGAAFLVRCWHSLCHRMHTCTHACMRLPTLI